MVNNVNLQNKVSAISFFTVDNFLTKEYEGKAIKVNEPIFLTDQNWPQYKGAFVLQRLKRYPKEKPLAVILDIETSAANKAAEILNTPEARYLAERYIQEIKNSTSGIDKVLSTLIKAFKRLDKNMIINPLEFSNQWQAQAEAGKRKWNTEYGNTFTSMKSFLLANGKILPKNEWQFLEWACDHVPGFSESTLRDLKIEQEYFWQFAEFRAKEITEQANKEKPKAKPDKSDLSHYLNETGKRYYPRILKQYKNVTKPQQFIYLIVALYKMDALTENPLSGNQTALFEALKNTFENVGTRQNLNRQLTKYFEELDLPRNRHKAKIEAVKKKLES